MGWLYMKSLDGHATPKAYLDNQFTFNNESGAQYEVLKSALKNLRTYYAAVEARDKEGALSVFAVVCLVRYNPRDKEGYIFGYKDMDESMGPAEDECPASILDLLTPPSSEYAKQWRARCYEKLARPKIKVGDTLVFNAPMRFTDGAMHSVFKVIPGWRKGSRVRFQAANGGAVCQISNIGNRHFRVVGINEGTQK